MDRQRPSQALQARQMPRMSLAPAQKRVSAQQIEALDADPQAKRQKMHEQQAMLDAVGEVMVAAQTDFTQHYGHVFKEQASTIRRLELEVQNLERARETARSGPVQQHDSSQLVALREELSRRGAAILEKDEQLREHGRRMDELRDELGSAQLEAVKLRHPAALVQGPDDSTIIDRFAALKHAISNLAYSELRGAPFRKPTPKHAEHFALLNGDTDDQHYNHYLAPVRDGPRRHKQLIFQALIWYKIIKTLLVDPTVVFCDLNDIQFIRKLAKNSSVAWRNFHNWRAYTADFLDTTFEGRAPEWRPYGDAYGNFVNELFELLVRCSSCAGGHGHSLKYHLEHVVNDAVALASVMAKSRAWWACCMTESMEAESKLRFGFQMRGESMEMVKGGYKMLPGGEKGLVNLIAQPALLKYGSGRGENHERCEVVQKAGVVVYG